MTTTEFGMTFPRERKCLRCGQPFVARKLRDIYCTWACHHAAQKEIVAAQDRTQPGAEWLRASRKG